MGQIRKLTNLLPQSVRFGLRRILFHGAEIQCVLCGNGVRKFGSHGGGAEVLDRRRVVGGMRRDEDRCPICHGRDRTRLMMLYLEEHTTIGKSATSVLHVAPDYGLYLWLRSLPDVNYIGTDIDASRYRHIPNMKTCDLTHAPFDTNSFDVVICSHVLEHVPDDAIAFAELYRILKPGGVALLLTPYAIDGGGTDEEPMINDPVEQVRRFGQWDHVRIYDRNDFLQRMESAGFVTELYDPFKINKKRADELHLNPLEFLPLGHKRI